MLCVFFPLFFSYGMRSIPCNLWTADDDDSTFRKIKLNTTSIFSIIVEKDHENKFQRPNEMMFHYQHRILLSTHHLTPPDDNDVENRFSFVFRNGVR